MPTIHPKIHLPLPTQGIIAGADDFHVPPGALRSTSFNWLFRNGKLVTRPGIEPLGQDTGTPIPLGIVTFADSLSIRHTIFSTTDGWWRYDDQTDQWDDITTGGDTWAGAAFVPVTFRAFNSGGQTYLLGVNGADLPLAWDANPVTNKTAYFGSGFTHARTIVIVADRVLLGHLSNDFSGIEVSAFQDHTSGWGTTQTATLVDTPGFIVAMQELGAVRAAIYKTNAIYLASGTTGLAPIRFDVQVTDIIGPMTNKTVMPINSSLHAVFTREAELYFFDGVNYTRHPASTQIRLLYEANASQEALGRAKAHGFYHSIHNELWFFYTRAGLEDTGPRDAIVVNLDNNSVWKIFFSKATFSFTASYYGEFFKVVGGEDTLQFETFLGNSNARIYLNKGVLDDTLSVEALLETGLSDLGEPTRVKSIEESEHYFANPASTQTPTINVLTSESGKDPDVSADQTLTLTSTSTGPYTTGHRDDNGERIASRFIGLRLYDDDLTDSLEYRGSSVAGAPRGFR